MEKLNWKQMCQSMASSYDPRAHARMQVDSFNLTPGDLKYMDCPKCRNKGVIACLRSDFSRYYVDCSCVKTRKAIARMEQSGLKASIRELTFAKFQATEGWQKDLKAGAMAYAKGDTGWFLICGQSGCGKTHLCTAICRERLRQGEDVHYMSWRQDVSRLKVFLPDDPQREKLLNRLKQVQLLYIDDLFKTGSTDGKPGKPTAADVNLAFEILNYRYSNRLRTILSTEMQVHDLLSVDQATCSRIIELAGVHVYAVKEGWERNYRLRNIACV